MIFHETPIAGMYLVELERRGDDRGWFARSLAEEELAEVGAVTSFPWGNISHTRHAGTVRGMHYQLPPSAEDKLVRCTRGALHDVGVDLRRGSASFGASWGTELSADNGMALLLPKGVAHGFQTLVDDTEASYLVSARYAPEQERGLRHDDPALGIEWPLPVSVISDKDRQWPDFGESSAVDVAVQAGGGAPS